MPKFQAPRGTRDLLPADMLVWRGLEDSARRLAALYGYQPIETPMFEDSAVFERGIGEVTDVVEKELGRLIDVEWENDAQQTYPIAIRIDAYDRQGLLNEITNVVAENKVNIIAANIRVNPDHTATIQATLQVASVAQLANVLSRIEQLKDVHAVQRELS
jgi:predicted amino acid-binding ACT domain protein